MTSGIYGSKISIKSETVSKLKEKFGREKLEAFLDEFNTAGRIEALTEKEGRFILGQLSLDSLRNRILKEAREANISPAAWQKKQSPLQSVISNLQVKGLTKRHAEILTHNIPGIEVHDSNDTLPSDNKGLIELRSSGKEATGIIKITEGYFDSKTGLIHILAHNIPTMTRLQEVIKHELVHRGDKATLFKMFGKDTAINLDRIKVKYAAEIGAIKADLKVDDETAFREWFAQKGDTYKDAPLFKVLYAKLLQILRKMGFNIEFSNNDLWHMIGNMIAEGKKSESVKSEQKTSLYSDNNGWTDYGNESKIESGEYLHEWIGITPSDTVTGSQGIREAVRSTTGGMDSTATSTSNLSCGEIAREGDAQAVAAGGRDYGKYGLDKTGRKEDIGSRLEAAKNDIRAVVKTIQGSFLTRQDARSESESRTIANNKAEILVRIRIKEAQRQKADAGKTSRQGEGGREVTRIITPGEEESGLLFST